MKTLRVLGLSVIAGAAAMTLGFAANAQQTGDSAQPAAADSAKPTITLDQVLQAVQKERRAVNQENKEREARFLRERNNQQAALTKVRSEVTAAEAESTRLEGVRNENDRTLEDLKAQLADKQGEFGELFGAARAAAGDLVKQLNGSLISAEFPGRQADLEATAQSETLPSIEQLEQLWFTMLQQATEQAKVVSFKAQVIGKNNQPVERTVTRIGPFVAFSDGKYLRFDNGQLKDLVRQPNSEATGAASRVEGYKGKGYVAGLIDPSLGQLLELVVEAPTLRERIDQGGSVGYTIIVIAIFGGLLAIYKWITLLMTSGAVRSQMRSKKASKGNPLGRVMLAYDANRSVDTETLQLKLDDAVLKELPRLESGLGLVKVIAAVAPLLGLLGTVVGMIQTFQAITLFGTGDPKLMAGGISKALVTTVEGLISAIPLLLLHSFAAGASRRVTQVLEEQSAGMIAEHAESRS